MINHDSPLTKAFWQAGRLDDCPILDFHAHMHELASMYLPAASPEAMIDTMRRCNVRQAVFCSHQPLYYTEFEEEYNLRVAKQYPQYFKAYHSVAPGRTDARAAIARVENNREYYFGFKFHADIHTTPLTDAAYAPFLDYMNATRTPALLHTWGPSPHNGVDAVKTIASRYADAILICGHSFHSDWRRGAALAADFPNLYYELTAVLDDYGALELLCETVGSRRILFGTDLPWFDTHHGIGAILSADITDEDRRNIFYRNGETLLERLG